MNGISPRPTAFTPTASQISSTIRTTVPDLPINTTDLIAQYAYEEFSNARIPLIFDEKGKLIDCAQNREILAATKSALSSSTCDPNIKRAILLGCFGFRRKDSDRFVNNVQILNKILDEIRDEGGYVDLNYVDFSKLFLASVNLSGASMVATRFIETTIDSVQMRQADLSGSLFRKSELKNVDLIEASLVKSVVDNTIFKNIDMSAADLSNAVYCHVSFENVRATEITSEDGVLQQIINGRRFDRRIKIYTTPA